jgi:hypothetical protein
MADLTQEIAAFEAIKDVVEADHAGEGSSFMTAF